MMTPTITPYCQAVVGMADSATFIPLTLTVQHPETESLDALAVLRERTIRAAEVVAHVTELGGRTNAVGSNSDVVIVEIPAWRFARLAANPGIAKIDIFRTMAAREVE